MSCGVKGLKAGRCGSVGSQSQQQRTFQPTAEAEKERDIPIVAHVAAAVQRQDATLGHQVVHVAGGEEGRVNSAGPSLQGSTRQDGRELQPIVSASPAG